jgi:hypothetical protein
VIPIFRGDEDKDEIDPMEWFNIAKKEALSHVSTKRYFEDKSRDWWYSLDKDTRDSKWKEFEKVSIDRWINDTKMRRWIKFKLN